MQQVAVMHNSEPTMTSIEIAEVVESRHDAVKRSIHRLATRGVIRHPPMEDVRNHQNQTVSAYLVSKRDSYVVVAQLSPEFTARLVDRWQALESRAANDSPHQLPGNYLEALECLVDTEKQKQLAQQEVTRLQGVCSTMSRQLADGLTVPEFCKQLNGVNTREVQSWLCRKGYLRHLNGGYAANSRYRDTWFAQKMKDMEGRPPRYYVALTEKGARNLYALYLRGELPMKGTWDGIYTHNLFDGVVQ